LNRRLLTAVAERHFRQTNEGSQGREKLGRAEWHPAALKMAGLTGARPEAT